ncbi:Splicing factor u2af-associated protein 2 [Gigaspora margarita]|uniref:Splicing factor u2af-associated protein 2 n=2 Tax=Gigaspora margarita TaxID=4874 RepID=A0A8H3XIB0_GIGMA|nr:Splicing factor u2af-associated protein 2 [Gigaspora margarita]
MSVNDSIKNKALAKEASPVPPSSTNFASDPHMHFVEETGKWTYTSEDGNTWEYNEEQQQWCQMDEEVLLKLQQLAYSVPGVDESEPANPMIREKRKKVFTVDDTDQNGKKKKTNNSQKKKPANTSVYVSGLPPDVTIEELAEVFSKYGVLLEDLNSGGPKIKLYKDDHDRLKGDALVTYFKEESVLLACQLLDETDLRPNEASKIRVQKAQFKEKMPNPSEDTNNTLVKQDKKKVQKKLHQLEKKLDWFEAEPGKKAERYSKIVILKYMFTLEELENDVSLILDLKEDIREECQKLGEVTNVVLYDKESDGIVSVKFKDPLSAEACVLKMNGRFFAGRKIEAHIFDGKQKYQKTGSKSNETEEEESIRLEKYAKWLEQDNGGHQP